MGQLFDNMKKFFEEDEWPVEIVAENYSIATGYEGENGKWGCLAVAEEDEETFVFVAFAQEDCPAEHRLAVGEFFLRFNPQILVGAFELDLDTGEIRFKNGIDVTETELDFTLWRNVVAMNCMLMDDFMPTINEIAAGTITAIEAMEKIGAALDDETDDPTTESQLH